MLNILPGRLQTNRVIPKGVGHCRVEFEAEVMARVSKLLAAYLHASKPDSADLPDVLDGVRRAIHESIEDKTIVEGLDPTAAALLGPVAEIVRDVRGSYATASRFTTETSRPSGASRMTFAKSAKDSNAVSASRTSTTSRWAT